MDLQTIMTGISVLIALWALFEAREARKAADLNLEKDEIRRRKVEIIYSLLGSRYVLSSHYFPSSSEVKAFNTSMALFTVFFASHPEVVRAYDTFLTAKSDENLTRMLKVAASSLGLDLLDSTVSRVVTVNARGPVAFQLTPASMSQTEATLK